MTRSHSRSDIGRIILTPRDLWAMRWTAEQKALRYDQLADLLGFWPLWQAQHNQRTDSQSTEVGKQASFTINAVRRVVNRWIRKGYATVEKPVSTEPMWLWITQRGLRELGLPYEAGFPIHNALPHLYLINQVRFRLARSQTYASYTWVSERAILARRHEGLAGVAYDHTPDAELMLEGQPTLGVEIELEVKSQTRLRDILRNLTGTYAQTLYFVNVQTQKALLKALAECDLEQQQRVSLFTL